VIPDGGVGLFPVVGVPMVGGVSVCCPGSVANCMSSLVSSYKTSLTHVERGVIIRKALLPAQLPWFVKVW
jgi:hypothetical protein